MGMAYLAAVATGSGVPLFIKTKGDLPPLPYPKLASLNGAHFFASSADSELQSCCNGGAKTVWKCFHESITLIMISSKVGPSDSHMTYLLDLVFSAMVLLVGLQELDSISNVEKLKKDIRCCFPLIDRLLDESSLLSPVTCCVDVIAVEDTAILQQSLDAFTEAAQSTYGCLLVQSRICVATESWWELSSLETSLLSLLLSSLPPATSRDIPVYLPKASNKVPHRLLVFTLLEGVELCVLCDSTPPLVSVEALIEGFWGGIVDTLRSCSYVYPRCVPRSVTFDPSLMGLCLLNLELGRGLSTLRPSSQMDSRVSLSAGFRGEVSSDKRYSYLVRFYKTIVDQFLPSKETREKGAAKQPPTLRETLPHKICETYCCTKKYKAYALHKDKYIFIALFSPSQPTFALRKVTNETFQQLISSHLTAFSVIR